MRRILLLSCISVLVGVCFGQQNRGYYRFPAVHGDTVVFTSEGDLWEVGIEGGLARRLTTHPAEETRAAFSPDGKTLAFSASYEGPQEVYTMPATGGLPVRRSFEGGRALVVGWTPDGKVLYATTRYSTLPGMQLAMVDTQNRAELVPLSQAAQGDFDAKNGAFFFTRLPNQGSSTKRYTGGSAENIWKYRNGQEAVPLTSDYPGTSKNAMAWNGRVYFLSDRDGTMNLWSMDENGKDLRQHTKHQGFDIKSASLSQGRVVYQHGADLRSFDISSGNDKLISIELPSDFDNLREHWVKNPAEYLTAVHLSPDGNSVMLTARGRAFVAPVKQGRFVDINEHKPGRFRNARMMPDGKSVILLSTESGEVEVWKYPANGAGAGEQLTHNGKVLRWEAIPSPDGKWIAHQDKDQQLWLLDLASKTEKRIAAIENGDNDEATFATVRWSPDSKWLTFAQNAKNNFTQIMLYSLDTGAATPLTTDRYNSGAADWSADGKWIYFLSDRSLTTVVPSPWGVRQPDPFFDRTDKVYEISLKKGETSPFAPADELHPPKLESKPPEKPAEKTPARPKVDIDLDSIASRIEEVPVPPGNYSDLAVAAKRLCWTNHDRADREKDSLECVDIANKGEKPEVLTDGVEGFEVSADGKKMLIHKKTDLFVVDAAVKADAMKNPKTLADAHVDLKNWNFSVIPTDEFKEAFIDAWRLHRDYFYDKNMHNVNWTLMRDKYSEFLGRIRDREELSAVLADMVSELSALHTFVHGGDLRKAPDQIQVASLGAAFARDDAAGGYRVEHIYRSDPDRPDKISPLLHQNVNLAEGDVITALNGRDILSSAGPGDLLRDQAGKQVLITYKRKGDAALHEAVAKAISMQQDADLRYSEWEYSRRQLVEQESGGQIGYVHLRAMGKGDIDQWVEQYSPVYQKQGLIVDVRNNRGGNIDSWILGKLLRKAWMYWQPRKGVPDWNMQEAFRGHLVVLCDQNTASDGEAFAEGFRRLGLGKVIGTRTWGGEIWLSASNVLADSGIASAAEMGVYGPERKWLIEQHGVDPDMVVDNLPHETFMGKDAQLEAGIQYLQKLIHDQPNPVPAPPPYPDKLFKTTQSKPSTSTSGGIR